MNKVVMMGRLVGDPKISYSKNGNAMAIARYRLAVARKSKKQGEAAADFFSCVVFGKSAEFAERYLHKGTQICISGRLQTGSYVNNENQKVTTTEIVVEDTSFAGPKQENTMPGNAMPNNQGYGAYAQQQNGYQTGPNNMQMPPNGMAGAAPMQNNGYGANAGMPANSAYMPQNQNQGSYYGGNQGGYTQNQTQGMAPNANEPGIMIPNGNGFMPIPNGMDEALPYHT